MSRRWRGVKARRGRFFEVPVPPPAQNAWVPPLLRQTRRPATLARTTRPTGRLWPVVRPNPQILDLTGARGITRWSAAEGPTRWAAKAVQRWSAREGGNG